MRAPNAGLQLRRAISIQADEKRLLEKHAIAQSAAGFVMRGVSGARISPSFLINATDPLCRTTLSKAPFCAEKLE